MDTEQLNQNISSENQENKDSYYLDYTLRTCEERIEYVKQLIPKLSPDKQKNPNVLENLSNYVINAIDKKEKKEKKLLTDNRMITINKRETSFEGIIEKLEYEDCFYSLINENKQTILTPKISITQKDLDEIPLLKEIKKDIAEVEKLLLTASGKDKYRLRKWLIELRQDQYIVKDSFRKTQKFAKITKNIMDVSNILDEEEVLTKEKRVQGSGVISLYNPKHIELLLQYYSKLKEDSYGHFESDLWYLMEDLDNIIEKALAEEYPMLYDILIMKIDGLYNNDISIEIDKKYGKKYTNEYISSLWRKKIPKLIAEAAEQDYLEWYYTVVEKGQWKKCSRCGQVKLAHNFYFSKNKSSRDGFYSICKCCRNAKNKRK